MNPSPETMRLVSYFQECHRENKLALKKEMSALIHDNIDRHYHWVTGAIKICRRDYGLVFAAERGLGYVPVKKQEVAKLEIKKAERRIRSTIDAASSVIGTVTLKQLEAFEENAALDHLSAIAKLHHYSTQTSQNESLRVEAEVRTIVEKQKHATGYAGVECIKSTLLQMLEASNTPFQRKTA